MPNELQAWTIDRHVDGAADQVVDLYTRFIELAQALGPFTYAVSKSNITLKGTRRGFAGAVPKRAALSGYFDLQRALPGVGDDPRLISVAPYTQRLYVHQFRITQLDQLDATFGQWLAEAYAVGNGAHVASRR